MLSETLIISKKKQLAHGANKVIALSNGRAPDHDYLFVLGPCVAIKSKHGATSGKQMPPVGMDVEPLPKTILFSQLQHDHRNLHRPRLRFNDNLTRSLSLHNIDHNTIISISWD